MKKNVRNFFILIGLVLLCVAFPLVLNFTEANAINDAPVRKKDLFGVSVNAVSILDVQGVMKMSAVNYLPNEFAELGETVSDANESDAPAKRGTYRFYIDTLTEEEWSDEQNVASLEHLLKPDGSWHLTMYIPPIFSACSVYVQYQNKEYLGSIDRYNIAYYTTYSDASEFDETVTHQTATQPLLIDIPVSAESKYSRECAVTIHYETDNANFVGLSEAILIGDEATIQKILTENSSLLLIGAIIGAGTLLLFLFICILKHSFNFIPQLLFTAGIFLALFSSYLLLGSTSFPYLLMGIRRFSVGFILLASTLYLPKKIGRAPVLFLALTVAAVAAALAFVSPLCTTISVYEAFCHTYTVISLICAAVVFGFTIYGVYKSQPLGLRLNNAITGVLIVTVLFIHQSFPLVALSPAFWLCLGMLGITLVLGFREFISAEIRNRYLTTNLEQEVERQTQSLQTILSEREKLLLYVSHDMKKTVVGMNGSLVDLRQSIYAPEQVVKVDYLLQKSEELKKDFADLGRYSKQNYVVERSEVLDLSQLVLNVTNDLRPDCEANGILLTVTLPEKLNVYAKKVALESVILNLVLNAIEHSFCTHLSVNATKRKGEARLNIIDDGQGITTEKDIFEPFVSGDASENNSGLGLFLAKTAVESMHGQLTYERKDNLTIFSATLPLA